MDFSAVGLLDRGKEADLESKIGKPLLRQRREGKQLNSIKD